MVAEDVGLLRMRLRNEAAATVRRGSAHTTDWRCWPRGVGSGQRPPAAGVAAAAATKAAVAVAAAADGENMRPSGRCH